MNRRPSPLLPLDLRAHFKGRSDALAVALRAILVSAGAAVLGTAAVQGCCAPLF